MNKNLKMIKTEFFRQILKILTIIFLILSLLFLLSSFFYHKEIFCLDKNVFNELYIIFKEYAGIYYATIILLSAYIAINQMHIAQCNNQTVIDQLNLTEENIQNLEENKKNEETIKQCQYYLENIQVSIKTLIIEGELDAIQISYDLKEFNSNELEEKYNNFKVKLNNTTGEYRANIVLTLDKIEGLANYFLYGNVNLELGKKLIGEFYCKQFELLSGMVSYFRQKDDKRPAFSGMIELYNLWKD